jgi:hypothetical protein
MVSYTDHSQSFSSCANTLSGLKNVFGPIHSLAPNAGILFGGHALQWIR